MDITTIAYLSQEYKHKQCHGMEEGTSGLDNTARAFLEEPNTCYALRRKWGDQGGVSQGAP